MALAASRLRQIAPINFGFRVQWMVASGNAEAQRFYEGIGARRDRGVAMFLRSQEFDALIAAVERTAPRSSLPNP